MRLPLHVFEPRYRALTRDAIDNDGVFAVALLQPGWENDYEGNPDVHPVIGAGVIERYESLADGRYNLLLRGVARLRIIEELEPGDYRCISGAALEDELPGDGIAGLLRPADTLKHCCERILTLSTAEGAGALLGYIGQIDDPPLLTNVISSLFVKDPDDQQDLLGTLSVETRLSRLTDLLAGMLIELETSTEDPAN